jgi:hypothetical protein
MISRKSLVFGMLSLAVILCLAVGTAGAAQAPQKTQPIKTKTIEEMTLPDVRAVLGMPMDDTSGVSDFTLGDNREVIIAYQYYDVDLDNYETDFASEIAPKIQNLYKRFKNLDRVRFEIVTNDPTGYPQWKPFSQFSMDRKTLEKLHWTWFVSRDILDQVLKNEK